MPDGSSFRCREGNNSEVGRVKTRAREGRNRGPGRQFSGVWGGTPSQSLRYYQMQILACRGRGGCVYVFSELLKGFYGQFYVL